MYNVERIIIFNNSVSGCRSGSGNGCGQSFADSFHVRSGITHITIYITYV